MIVDIGNAAVRAWLNDLDTKILDQFAIFALKNIYLVFLRLKEFEG